MKATEILDELEALFKEPFDPSEFAFAFIDCFPKSKTTLARLRKGSTNKSDIDGAVLQRNAIHIHACPPGTVETSLAALRESPQTAKQKAKFILATDGDTLQAENLATGDVIACNYLDLPDKHFGFLLPLAGISTNKEIRDNPIDIKATNRLDKLYQALASANPDWTTPERREDFNHFMAQLIFCFYAEDTSIFRIPGHGLVGGDGIEGAGERKSSYAGLFTETVREMTAGDGSDTREVIRDIFHAMNLDTRNGKGASRIEADLKNWADHFPYVNGRLFESETEGGAPDVPHFTQMARSYLIAAGELKWTDINPDIFGSMIQAVADDEERGSLGMHYTSVPNILKVLNPLFLDSLRDQLAKAGTNPQQLGKFKKRLAHIRVFDPACGSGNFLVIAYKRMRELEHIANILGGRAERRNGDGQLGGKAGQTRVCALWEAEVRGGEGTREALEAELRQWNGEPSVIPLTNFRGIEIKGFAAEVARLALVIAEYQCDTLYLGQKRADALFLPLDQENWIFKENALRIDWLKVCPPAGETKVSAKLTEDDLFNTPLKQTEIDFENEGGETYICGNPPYLGGKKQSAIQKKDMKRVFGEDIKFKDLDYSTAFIWNGLKAVKLGGSFAFVVTSSVNQGKHVPDFWQEVLAEGGVINFAITPFKWANSAKRNASVWCTVAGVSSEEIRESRLISGEEGTVRRVENISPYLTEGDNLIVTKRSAPLSDLSSLITGNAAYDETHLSLNLEERDVLLRKYPNASAYLRPVTGTTEFKSGKQRWAIWVKEEEFEEALQIPAFADRFELVRNYRSGGGEVARSLQDIPYRFRFQNESLGQQIVFTQRAGEEEYFLADLLPQNYIVTHLAYVIYDASLTDFCFAVSKLHLAWAEQLSGRHGNALRYSANLVWNTFPVPPLTSQNKADLTRAAENILLAREAHFPATIADLYKPASDKHPGMPEDLRAAHAENDRILEEIYIGRPFRNDTERLEKLFEMYAEMVKGKAA